MIRFAVLCFKVPNKNMNIRLMQNCNLVFTYFYIGVADTGLELVERGLIKVLHFNYSKFLLSQLRNQALFSKR